MTLPKPLRWQRVDTGGTIRYVITETDYLFVERSAAGSPSPACWEVRVYSHPDPGSPDGRFYATHRPEHGFGINLEEAKAWAEAIYHSARNQGCDTSAPAWCRLTDPGAVQEVLTQADADLAAQPSKHGPTLGFLPSPNPTAGDAAPSKDSLVERTKTAMTEAFSEEVRYVARRMRQAADDVERMADPILSKRDGQVDHAVAASRVMHAVANTWPNLGLSGVLNRAAEADRYHRNPY